jgi:hypothetical protein
VDRVLHYETLMMELWEVFGQLGIPFDGTLRIYAKSRYRPDHRPYREVYTPRQAEIIRKAFAHEIALHHYEF